MSIQNLYPSLKPALLLDFSNTKAVDPRVTFVRSTTAKYYDGVTTAKAEENLFLYSQEFDNAYWSKSNVTVTANAVTAPDGTTTADEAVSSNTGVQVAIVTGSTAVQAIAGQPLVISIYAKANTAGYLQIVPTTAVLASAFANFDLLLGVVGTFGGTGLTTSITAVGSGWYRCVVVIAAATGTGALQINLVDSASSARASNYTGTIGNSLYLWGAQLEQRSAVTAYTPTTTQPITNYIPVLQTAAAGVPRIDHDPVTGECLGLLIEEQRTNLLTYSEQFDNAAWTKNSSSITANTIVAPDGTLTGDKIVATGSNPYINQLETVTAQSYTVSCFAKAGELPWFRMTWVANATWTAWFNLSTGVTGTVRNGTASITPVGNGWYRCSYTFTPSATTDAIIFGCSNANDTTTGYTGDGYSGVYIWGTQLEVGAFPTSYIPTVATQETRNADAASMTGTNFSSWYNAGEGTLYIEGAILKNAPNGRTAFISDVSGSNYIGNTLNTSSGNCGVVITNGSSQAGLGIVSTTGVFVKQAIAYAFNDFAFSQNGASVLTDNTVVLPVVNRMGIGNLIPANCGSGHTKKISYYPQRLTNANLQALTA